jgi:hypothetical protein
MNALTKMTAKELAGYDQRAPQQRCGIHGSRAKYFRQAKDMTDGSSVVN